jgi:aminoglycoside phosphotransferase family enzyme
MTPPPMIQDLLNPAALPDPTKKVSLVQTHISVVLLADHFAYKIKKPVNFGFLDFLTLEKRAFYCEQELKLNRRLAKDIYIAVLPVFFDGKSYCMGIKRGQGRVVEYAVKMKRIRPERLMTFLFEKDALTATHLHRLAKVLAHFHKSALRTAEIDRFGEPEAFKVNTEENFAQVREYTGVTIRKKQFNDLKRWTEKFYRSHRLLFYERVEKGKIRDCHGDLHMEHVCFTRPLSIIDCIEFNDRFRYSDAVADMAFLLMDLEYHGGESLSRRLWNEYQDMTDEKGSEELLLFYKVYRAFVRGKVNSFQVDDQGISAEAKEGAVARAKKYFDLASSYIA